MADILEFTSSGTGPADVGTAVAEPSEPSETETVDTDSGDEGDGERVEEVVSDDDTDSEGEEPEVEAEEEDVTPGPKDPRAAKKAALEKRIREMAAKKGLDLKDPVIYDLLRENAIMEQRREDSQAFADKIKQEIDWETPWEKEQRAKKQAPAETKSAETKPPAAVHQPARSQDAPPPQYRPYVRVDQSTGAQSLHFGDGFDSKWQSPRDAYDQLSATWAKIGELEAKEVPPEALGSLYGEIDNIQRAITRRHMIEVFPHVHEMIRAELQQFRNTELADVVPVVRSSMKQRNTAAVYEAVHDDFTKNPQVAEWFNKIRERPKDGATIKLRGQEVPASLLNQTLASQPELLEKLEELENDPNVSEEVLRKEIHRTYKLVMRQAYDRQERVRQSKALVKQATTAGEEQASRRAEKTAVRQATPAADGTPAPTRKGRSLLNPYGPGLSVAALNID